MEEVKNFTQDDVLEVIKDFPHKPLRNRLIITVNTEKVEEDKVKIKTESLCESQFVVAAGKFVDEDLKPGQKVLLDLQKMTKPNGSIELDPLQVGDKMYAFIYDSYLKSIDLTE